LVPLVVDVTGLRLHLWTVATDRSIVHQPDDIWAWRVMVEWDWQGTTEELRENPASVPLCPPLYQYEWAGHTRWRMHHDHFLICCASPLVYSTSIPIP
jgi:hypothetical protein